jgi:SAM-dependent methyltransferase
LPDAGAGWLAAVPERFRRPLAAAAAGTLPPNVALMRLLMEAHDDAEAQDALRAARRLVADRTREAAVLDEVARLHEEHPDAFATVKAVLARVMHDQPPAPAEDGIGTLATAFDRAVRAAPEASVALYTLGSPELLRAATREVVEALGLWGLLGRDKSLLEIGCGIGRFEEALAPEVRFAVGVDVSAAMLAQARRRCAALPNTAFLRSSGLDLAAFADGGFDLVLAIDSFPYLVQAGGELAARHIEEAARVLKPGGDLVILNFSYRGDLDLDRADIAASADGKLRLVRGGERPFRLWDGAAFHLAKPAAEPT